jgi:leucyl-tRNA synthetase
LWKLVIRNIKLAGSTEADIDNELKKQELTDFEQELYRKLHQTIRKVTEDILSRFNFNTAISAVMELVNLMYKYQDDIEDKKKNAALVGELTGKLLLLLSPIVPFITEELWSRAGNPGSIHKIPWPDYDKEIAKEELVTIIFQVNGKLRDRMDLPLDTSSEEIEKHALSSKKVNKYIKGREVIKKIVIPNKLINIVVKD